MNRTAPAQPTQEVRTAAVAVAAEVGAAINRAGFTPAAVADCIGLTTTTFRRRLDGTTHFTMDELFAVSLVLDANPADFFTSTPTSGANNAA